MRDFASIVSGTEAQFEIKYDSKTNTVNIIKGGVYTSVGNEMLLDNSEKYITKKSNYHIAVDGTVVDVQCYTIDGDLYFDIEQLSQILGMTAQKKQDEKGYIVATMT